MERRRGDGESVGAAKFEGADDVMSATAFTDLTIVVQAPMGRSRILDESARKAVMPSDKKQDSIWTKLLREAFL
jgi:hypothetical protein